MSMPTIEELAALFMDHFGLAMNTTPGTCLADMSDKEVDDHVDASRETAIAAVRDTILDALIAEGEDIETCLSDDGTVTMWTIADWLRAMREEGS